MAAACVASPTPTLPPMPRLGAPLSLLMLPPTFTLSISPRSPWPFASCSRHLAPARLTPSPSQYALSEHMLKPASMPHHYTRLVEAFEKSAQGIARPWWKIFFGIW